MAEAIQQKWRDAGEVAYANWFKSVYLHEQWTGWHVNATSIAGVLPSQQSIESHHAAIKLIAAENLRAPTATVLNLVLPRLLVHDGYCLADTPIRHYCEGKSLISCTCKCHAQTGWVCAHTVAALAVLDLFDVDMATASVPVVRNRGRPRKYQGALTVEEEIEGEDGHDPYSIDALMKSFVKNSGRPLLKPVVEEYVLTNENGETKELLAGQVISVRVEDGVHVWRVRFGNGDEEDMQCERLAASYRKAYMLGTR